MGGRDSREGGAAEIAQTVSCSKIPSVPLATCTPSAPFPAALKIQCAGSADWLDGDCAFSSPAMWTTFDRHPPLLSLPQATVTNETDAAFGPCHYALLPTQPQKKPLQMF